MVVRSGHRQDTATTVPQLLYSEVARARSLQAQDVFGEKPCGDSSALVSVYAPLSNEQKNSPEVKNEPSGVLTTPLSGVPDGTKTSGSQTTDSECNGQWTEVRRRKRQNQTKKSPASPVPRESKNVLTTGHTKIVQSPALIQIQTAERQCVAR